MSEIQNAENNSAEQAPSEEFDPIETLSPRDPMTGAAETAQPKASEKKPASKGFISRIKVLFSKDLKKMEDLTSEADKIYASLDDAVSSFREFRKELTSVVKQIDKDQKYHTADMERLIERLRTDVREQLSSAQQFHSEAVTKIDTAVGAVSGVNDSLKGIRGFLDENSRVTKRFEEGYDYQILKNFVRQIARSIKNIERQMITCENVGSQEELVDVRDDLVEMLERNSIRQIIPPVGEAYDGMEQFVEVSSEKIPATDPAMAGKIAEIESIGYRYEFNDGQQRIIQAARVKLYDQGAVR